MSFCSKCDGFMFRDGHTCAPVHLVWCDSYGETIDEAVKIYAVDCEEAAEKWAAQEDWHGAEYDIVSQRDEPIVSVSRDGICEEFKVRGEAVPTYYASPVR